MSDENVSKGGKSCNPKGTQDGISDFEKSLKKTLREGSGKNGYCSNDNCGGLIVKQVCGFGSGRYIYSIPYCSKCGRIYRFVTGQPIGHREFHERLDNIRFTL